MFSNDLVLVHIELLEAIVELAPNSKPLSGFWSCEHCVESSTFKLTSTQS